MPEDLATGRRGRRPLQMFALTKNPTVQTFAKQAEDGVLEGRIHYVRTC